MNSKPGEAQIGVGRRWRVAAKGEVLRPIWNPCRLAVRHLVDVDARRVKETAVEELHLKRQLLVAPQRVFGQKTYLPIMVVIEVFEIVGQLGVGRLVWLAGRIAGELPNKRSVERSRFRSRSRNHARLAG